MSAAKHPKARPLWIRANPRRLSKDELEELRSGPHLADLELSKRNLRALLWAGHRWAREMNYLTEGDLMALPHMDRRDMHSLKRVLNYVGVEVGSKSRDRVNFPR